MRLARPRQRDCLGQRHADALPGLRLDYVRLHALERLGQARGAVFAIQGRLDDEVADLAGGLRRVHGLCLWTRPELDGRREHAWIFSVIVALDLRDCSGSLRVLLCPVTDRLLAAFGGHFVDALDAVSALPADFLLVGSCPLLASAGRSVV